MSIDNLYSLFSKIMYGVRLIQSLVLATQD